MSGLTFTFDIRQVEAAIDQEEKRVLAGLSASIPRLLDFIEAVQIDAYTATGNPAQPPGSEYIRTFDLQESSDRNYTPGSLEGEWFTDLDYAEYVLGKESEQAAVHRGRWKSIEDVERETLEAGPKIIEDTVREYTTR